MTGGSRGIGRGIVVALASAGFNVVVNYARNASAADDVVSREFGIPAVVGTSDATRQIKTGDRVRVNGATGVVEVLA